MRTSEPYPYSRYEREDGPTRAELEAEENDDPLWGMVRCRYDGCRTYFHGDETTGARRHYTEVHGE